MITSEQVCLIKIERVPVETFDRWCERNRIPVHLRAVANVEVAALDLAFGPATASAKGKARGRLDVELERRAVRARYNAEVPTRLVTVQIEPNPGSEKYLALLRVLNKRETARAEYMEAVR
jgi:hypothetical protein